MVAVSVIILLNFFADRNGNSIETRQCDVNTGIVSNIPVSWVPTSESVPILLGKTV